MTLEEIANQICMIHHSMPCLRDQLAMAALKGLLSNVNITDEMGIFDELSVTAYEVADSMLKARQIEKNEG